MTLTITQQTITNDEDDEFSVFRDGDRIKIRWTCGDSFRWHPDDARSAMDSIETLVDYPDVWLDLVDSDGQAFSCRLVDGVFYADTVRYNDLDSVNHLDWSELRIAVARTIRVLEPVSA